MWTTCGRCGMGYWANSAGANVLQQHVCKMAGGGQPPVPQRQDSLDAQLRDVAARAVEMGCWDAADWIRRSAFPEDYS